MRRIAVVGSGIAGLACAYRLSAAAQVTLFESGAYFGGHSHTVDVQLDGITHGVDTGFLVFNHRTYPNLVRLFDELQIETAKSEMSFSVQLPDICLEWSGRDLNGVFAQRGNLLSPRFLRMLADILRFNKLATALAECGAESDLQEPIEDFLSRHAFGPTFRDWYFLPMIGCIWSCPTSQMLRFPVATMIRFCHNHGLLQVAQRPQWFTVRGGARHYVDKMLKRVHDVRLNTPVLQVRRQIESPGRRGVDVSTSLGSERFDEVVLACHSDQSLALLADAQPDERAILGAILYHPNQAVLHTDIGLLPKRRRAWAAWNYERATHLGREKAGVCLHYLINQLQPVPWDRPVVVSLNPAREPEARHVIGRFDYSHPVFDQAAIEAQRRLPTIQGRSNVWFCGAWTRYGFHEDGLMSAQAVVAEMQERWQRDTVREAA
jgi:predicted NAD/FAD-binding protein